MNESTKEMNGKTDVLRSFFLVLSLLFFMIYSVCTEVVLFRYAVIAAFVLLLLLFVKSRLLTLLAALPCLAAFALSASSGAFALAVAAVAVIGFGGFAVSKVNPWLLSLAPVGAYIVALLLTNNFITSLSVLFAVPCALVLALSLKRKLPRTATVAAVAATLAAVTVLMILLAVYLKEGSITAQFFTDFITGFRETMIAAMLEAVKEANLTDTLSYDADTLRTAFNLLIRLVPALAIIAAEVLAYFGNLLTLSLYGGLCPEKPLPREVVIFRMSGVSAALFLISFVVFFLFPSDSEVVGIGVTSVTALNLNLILLPGLALSGVMSSLVSIKQRKRISLLAALLFLAALIFYTAVIPYLLAILGAVAILRTDWKQKHRNGNNTDIH